MDHLPKNDAAMLVSAINFLLRDDQFESLEDICNYYDESRAEIESMLNAAGYVYSEELKKCCPSVS